MTMASLYRKRLISMVGAAAACLGFLAAFAAPPVMASVIAGAAGDVTPDDSQACEYHAPSPRGDVPRIQTGMTI